MAEYYLRDIDPTVWKKFHAAVAEKGLTKKEVLLAYVERVAQAYEDGHNGAKSKDISVVSRAYKEG